MSAAPAFNGPLFHLRGGESRYVVHLNGTRSDGHLPYLWVGRADGYGYIGSLDEADLRRLRRAIDIALRAPLDTSYDEPATLRDYLVANMFDGDDQGDITMRMSTLADEVCELVSLWMIDQSGVRRRIDDYYTEPDRRPLDSSPSAAQPGADTTEGDA